MTRAWAVELERTLETETSLIAFGTRAGIPVVLKLAKEHGDEWRSGEVLDAFAGCGVARVLQFAEGAVLMERLDPGTSLAERNVTDEEATRILAGVIGRMAPRRSVPSCPNVRDWAAGFDRYTASGDERIPATLVDRARSLYLGLCDSQREIRLLHGDLHHYNVLFDSERGWAAIDPKGVVGEVEYEVGAMLRNPVERPEVFGDPAVIEKRLAILAAELKLNHRRALEWGFAQAVLSAIWEIEDTQAEACATPQAEAYATYSGSAKARMFCPAATAMYCLLSNM